MTTHPSPAATDTARRLAQTTLALVDTESISRNEGAIVEAVAAMIDRDPTLAEDDSLFYAPARDGLGRSAEQPRGPGRPLVVFAGHLDTVPPQDNLPGRIENGAVHGLGASDMKGAIAVMIELIRRLDNERPEVAIDPGFLFFPREELTPDASPISGLLEASATLRDADLVVVMEPTANAIQLGCLGNLNADVTFAGTSSHSARPWLGSNAIHRAIEALQAVAASSAKEVRVEGLNFYEVVNVTGITGGIARNVIPDEVTCHLNFRYAPNRSAEEAERRIRSLVGRDASLEVVGNAPPARVATANPLVDRLRAASGASVGPKQAWTNVAEFSRVGIDAVNFGPGPPEFAHRVDEQVSIDALVKSLSSLERFVVGR
ncbi:MAG: succinyl-diaminopimelate desuccinylase [Actinomycetota bacterium]|nr:succinyl-diaminopimelate desuccinylase [Actinomycetota bacterium]